MIRSYLHSSRPCISVCLYNGETDRQVQSGLGVTPSQMLELTKRGVPISPANLGLAYQEGVGKLDFKPPLEYQRGVDIGNLWEARQDSKLKLKKAVKALAEKGGDD